MPIHLNEIIFLYGVLSDTVIVRNKLSQLPEANILHALGEKAYLYKNDEQWEQDTRAIGAALLRLNAFIGKEGMFYLLDNEALLIRDSLVLYAHMLQRHIPLSEKLSELLLHIHWLRESLEEHLCLKPVD